MVRSRVLSFMNQFSHKDSNNQSRTSTSPVRHPPPERITTRQDSGPYNQESRTSPVGQQHGSSDARQSPAGRQRASSRPISMVSTYQPPLMEVTQDTLPELQPIFIFLNSHANKLYQEGYFLKLDDQNSQGKPNADRTWTECFAQLVGTVLSLWDAAELDAAGQDGEVLPKFINLTDASIKMIEALPTRNNDDQPLQNVLSISTAGKNRYLLHFNSHHSLLQWTAGIRLAMFEYATLQEAYTGALIAGKGRQLNNINIIMERNRFVREDWVRVRFGAGTPWRRCWCVITPPDEKEFNKLQKEMNKKKSAYDRSRPILKGDVKFYDTKKTKKVKPIATLTEAYCAYAIYPQSKPLIDQSTLIKVEGTITIHSNPPTSTEGFVFLMPEVHPAVSGFEIMLRWFFPAMDTFALYGRPGRLIADTTNPKSLMFAMPNEKGYGYLEILDVTNLILAEGSHSWSERQWRFKMKDITAKRMTAIANGTRHGSRYSQSTTRQRTVRNSTGGYRRQSTDGASVKSTPSISWGNGPTREEAAFGGPPRTDSAPAAQPFKAPGVSHHRSVSESQGLDRYAGNGMDGQYDQAPTPPQHAYTGMKYQALSPTPERRSFEDDRQGAGTPVRELQDMQQPSRVEPVAAPPKFSHPAGTLPPVKPYQAPELRRAKSRMSQATLAQMTGSPIVPADFQTGNGMQDQMNYSEDRDQRGVPISPPNDNSRGMNANHYDATEGLVTRTERLSFDRPIISDPNHESSFSTRQQLPPTSTYRAPQSHDNLSNLPSEGFQGHAYNSSSDSTRDSSRIRARESIIRKPLPGSMASRQEPPSNITSRQHNSTSNFQPPPNAIDKATYDRMVAQSRPNLDRQESASSQYDDNASTASPDYASTRPSTDTKRSIEKPRAGVMKTVGSEVAPPLPSSNVPQFDFGPTYNYAALPRDYDPQHPKPAGKSMGSMEPTHSQDRSGQAIEQSKSHVKQPSNLEAQSHSRGSSRDGPPNQSRQVPWQPGMAARPQTPQAAISPEQFVQQRAAGSIPMYAQHGRSTSTTALRSGTPTPPLQPRPEYFGGGHSRNNSSELLGSRPQSRSHTRSPSGFMETHSRSHSRSPSSMGVLGSGEISSKLSAREQEHVARVTGSPLVNVPQSKGQPQAGLVGAIDIREREKKQLKSGLTSQAVEREIAQRQQQAFQMQQAQIMQQQYQQQSYGYPQQAMPPTGPGPAAYAPGGGWVAQTQGRTTPEAMGGPQYLAQQGQQQQYGRGPSQQGYRG